jgi:UMF1 family MFS transporter
VAETAVVDPPEAPSTRRERTGWYFYDWAASAFNTTVISVFLGPYLGSIARTDAGCVQRPDDTWNCDGRYVHALGLDISPGSLFTYAVSLSVILQVIVLPVTGALADRTSHKKRLLALFAYFGAACTVGLVTLTGSNWQLGTLLFILANVSFGASFVVYNSFLPQLASEEDRDRVSSLGWAVGYLGGGLLLLLNVAATQLYPDHLDEVARWSMVSAGVWWAAFTAIPLIRLKDRPATGGEHRGSVLTDGFKQLWGTLRGLKAYPLSLFFLIAYLVYNDGIQTVIAVAGTYGVDELGFDYSVLVILILVVQFVAFGGALILGALARRIGAWKTVLLSLVAWTVIVTIAYFLPRKELVPFIALGIGIGFVLGGSQALSRSLFSQLIPKGKEGEYFGLYEISDKGTSWLGTLIFGLAFQMTQSYRVAILSLMAFFIIGFLGLLAVPMRRAIEQAGNTPPRVL